VSRAGSAGGAWRIPDRALPWLSVAGVLVLFDLLPRIGVLPRNHFPPMSETLGTFADLGCNRLLGGRAEAFRIDVAVRAREGEAESLDRPHEVAFEAHFAALVDFRARH